VRSDISKQSDRCLVSAVPTSIELTKNNAGISCLKYVEQRTAHIYYHHKISVHPSEAEYMLHFANVHCNRLQLVLTSSCSGSKNITITASSIISNGKQ
jgi:hypothetical protein